MKICFLVVECSLDSVMNGCGGVGTFYSSLAKQLVSNGHQVEVLVFPVYNLVYEPIIAICGNKKQYSRVLSNCDEYIFNEDNVTVRYILHSSYNCKYLEFSNEYYLFIKDYVAQYCLLNAPDIIEASEGGGYIKYISVASPIVIRLHSGYTLLSKFNSYDAHWINPIIDSEYLGFAVADSISGVSNYVIEQTQSMCILQEEKLYGAIHNGIEPKQFSYSDYSTVESKTLICIGGLYEGKGIARLLRLFNEIYALDNEVKLILIGKGNLDNFVSNLSSSARNNVIHYAHVKHSEVAIRLKTSSLFITASMHEACPLSPMEAMAVGRAVFVYSDCNSFCEIVTNNVNGIIWRDVGDVIGAAKSVVNLLSHQKEMELMGRNGRYVIDNKFGIKRLVLDSEKWYQNVIDNYHKNRERNDYKQLMYMRNIIVSSLSDTNINNNVIVDVALPLNVQVKKFLKQVLMHRGIDKKDLLSLTFIKKVCDYIKNKVL